MAGGLGLLAGESIILVGGLYLLLEIAISSGPSICETSILGTDSIFLYFFLDSSSTDALRALEGIGSNCAGSSFLLFS